MKLKGKCIKYGDDINTDLIIAGKYTKTLNIQDLVDHVMEDLDSDFKTKVQGRALIVAGEYFGCGSSREQAPVALKESGVICIVAKSFSRIFYRSAINIGLPIVECDTKNIKDGDVLEYTSEDGKLSDLSASITLKTIPLSAMMAEILQCGGIAGYIKKHGVF
jgi:3-isopropylmalate/(R)-2-methylmalate dehydratase small subunit